MVWGAIGVLYGVVLVCLLAYCVLGCECLLFGVLCYLGYLVVFSDGMNGRFGLVCCDFAVGITFVSLVDAALGLLVWLCIVGFVVLWCLRAGAFRGVCLLCLLLFADWLFRPYWGDCYDTFGWVIIWVL